MKKETKEKIEKENKEEVRDVKAGADSSSRLWGLVVVLLVVAAIAAYFMTNQDKASDMTVASGEPEIVNEADTETATNDDTTSTEEVETASEGDPTVVAKVEGRTITRGDVEEFVSNIPQLQQQPMEQVFPLAREELVTGEIIDMRADKEGTANDPEVAERLELAREGIVRTVYLEKKVNEKLTDAELRKAYEDFKTQQEGARQEEVKARHILVDSEDKAKELIAKLQDGADFAKLAEETSSDSASGAKGGDLGYFTKAQMVPAFSQAAFALEKGEVTDEPVKSQFGYHVIKVEDKRMQPLPSFEEVKTFLEVQKRREILESMLKEWRQDADVTLYNLDGSPQESMAPANTEPAAASDETTEPASSEETESE